MIKTVQNIGIFFCNKKVTYYYAFVNKKHYKIIFKFYC